MYDFDKAVERLNADVAAAFDLFGSRASSISFLEEQLGDGATASARTPFVADYSLGRWWHRAAHLLARLQNSSPNSVFTCVETAFDDPDARVRGIAWCLLAEQSARKDANAETEGTIERAFFKRISGLEGEFERRRHAGYFVALFSASVAGARAREVHREMETDYIERHAGVDAPAIQSGLEAAIHYLNHPDSDRRLAALRAIVRLRGDDVHVSARLIDMLHRDPDRDVRRCAIVAYTDMMKGTCDQEGLRRLAEIVLNDDEALRMRFIAYDALFRVVGADSKKRPLRIATREALDALRDSSLSCDWPVDVDWNFVHRCLRGFEPHA